MSDNYSNSIESRAKVLSDVLFVKKYLEKNLRD